jgi:hypothetical protein
MRRIASLAGVVAAVGVFSLISATSAFATTYTITNGGTALSFKAGTTTLKDTRSNNTLTCTSSSSTADIPSGSNNGSPLGTVTALSFSSCTGPLNISFTVTPSGLPYKLDATSSSGGVTDGTMAVSASLSGSLCTATVSGTVDGTYTNSTHTLAVSPDGNLLTVKSASCLGVISKGDVVDFNGSYVEQGSGPYLSVT